MKPRAFFPLSVALAAVALSATAHAAAPIHDYSSLDYGRQHASGSVVFVPFLSSDPSFEEGITFYTSYFNDVESPVAWGPSVKSVRVAVYPTAHKDEQAEYIAFFDGTSRVDKQEWWFTTASPCSLSSELDVFTAGLPPELQPQVRNGGYPEVCSATIYYRTSQEAALLRLLRANKGVVIEEQLPFCTSASPVFSTAPLVAELVARRTLADDGTGSLTGTWTKVQRSLRSIREQKPALLGGASAAQNGEVVFRRDAFDVTTEGVASLRDGYADTRLTACSPSPLTLRYGR